MGDKISDIGMSLIGLPSYLVRDNPHKSIRVFMLFMTIIWVPLTCVVTVIPFMIGMLIKAVEDI